MGLACLPRSWRGNSSKIAIWHGLGFPTLNSRQKTCISISDRRPAFKLGLLERTNHSFSPARNNLPSTAYLSRQPECRGSPAGQKCIPGRGITCTFSPRFSGTRPGRRWTQSSDPTYDLVDGHSFPPFSPKRANLWREILKWRLTIKSRHP